MPPCCLPAAARVLDTASAMRQSQDVGRPGPCLLSAAAWFVQNCCSHEGAAHPGACAHHIMSALIEGSPNSGSSRQQITRYPRNIHCSCSSTARQRTCSTCCCLPVYTVQHHHQAGSSPHKSRLSFPVSVRSSASAGSAGQQCPTLRCGCTSSRGPEPLHWAAAGTHWALEPAAPAALKFWGPAWHRVWVPAPGSRAHHLWSG